ncbi:MAG: hypothetical protein ACR2KZ_20735 [Segetibacter sp.]
MTEVQPHILDDKQWHPVVPAGEVWGIKASCSQPRILWLGKAAVKDPFHQQAEFEEDDCIPAEFHRYKNSWNVDDCDKTFEGEVITDKRRIPATVWLTVLGFAIHAIEKPAGAEFDEIQLELPIKF